MKAFPDERPLDGAVALVTGSSRGIGRAVCRELASRGARVTGASRSDGIDVADESQVEALFSRIEAEHGAVDILVNNAGVLTPRAEIREVSTADWDRSMAVNLRAVFLCTRAALRQMVPRGRGLIVNISSGAGKRPAPGWGPYGVAKWGVEGLSLAADAEVRASGVRVVAVNPGGTRTDMRARAYPEENAESVKTPETFARALADYISAPGEEASIDYPFLPEG